MSDKPEGPVAPEWVSSDEWLVFITDRTRVPGEVDQHGLKEWWSNLRGKSVDDAKHDFRRVFGQIESLVDDVPLSVKQFDVDEIEVGLAFSAEGQIAFIAKAGIEASVTVTLKRK